MQKRRDFLKQSSLMGMGLAFSPQLLKKGLQEFPVRQITRGPKSHWFGYYDKWQVDPSGRYALGMEVDIPMRSPTEKDVIKIGMVDLQDNDRWIEIGQSTAWSWQQGCMLQWVPGSMEEVIWNARLENTFVSVIYNVKTGQRRILPRPVYTLSPEGSFALGVDFARLQVYRPGYGYATQEPFTPENAPADKGIYKVDLKTGETNLILSYKEVAGLGGPLGDLSGYHHWINHLLINPSGTRFIFLNRSRSHITKEEWRANAGGKLKGEKRSYLTRAITANTDGSDLYALNESGRFSHFIWKGDDAICAYSQAEDNAEDAFYLYQDKTKKYEIIGKEIMTVNGHNTYVPNTNYEWILNDTYPQGSDRMQELYLYHVPSKKKVILGRFHEPEKFSGEWRCDLHPRTNQQGTQVIFDSTHNNNQRQMYLVDISQIVS